MNECRYKAKMHKIIKKRKNKSSYTVNSHLRLGDGRDSSTSPLNPRITVFVISTYSVYIVMSSI